MKKPLSDMSLEELREMSKCRGEIEVLTPQEEKERLKELQELTTRK